MEIKFDDIIIKNRYLIRGRSVHLPNTGIFLIKGKNGVGKTLLLKNIFHNLSEPDPMSIFIDQSNNQILPKTSALKNIAMHADSDNTQVTKDFLSKYGFEYLLDHDADKISGGEKRIISILRGLLTDAVLIFIDEPTNDLDYSIVEKLVDILVSYSKSHLFLIISHDDRIEKIADGILNIENHEVEYLESVKNTHGVDHLIDKDVSSKTIDKTFAERYFPRRFHSLILYVLLLLTGYFCLSYLYTTKDARLDPINADQVDIYSPVSKYGSAIKDGALPISFFGYVEKESSLKELYDSLMKARSDAQNQGLSFGLNLESTDQYTLYNLEYYLPESQNSEFTLDVYLQANHGISLFESKIDTSGYFDQAYFYDVQGDGSTVQTFAFDPVLFLESVAAIESVEPGTDHSYEVVYCTLILNEGFDFYDLLEDPDFKALYDGNFYVRSNETISIVNQINSLLRYGVSLIIFTTICLIVLLLEFIFAYTYFLACSRKITIFKNYSYSETELSEIIMKRYRIRWMMILVSLIMFAINLFLFWPISDGFVLGTYLYTIYFVVSVVLLEIISRRVARKSIKKRYDWRFR